MDNLSLRQRTPVFVSVRPKVKHRSCNWTTPWGS